MPCHLHIDPFAGIAGDMFLGALIDIGVDLHAVQSLLERAGMQGQFRLSTQKVMRHGIGATDLKVEVRKATAGSPATANPVAAPLEGILQPLKARASAPSLLASGLGHTGATHHHVNRGHILAIIDRLDVADRAKGRARRVVNALAEAEALVHRMSVDEVHFHEVGAVDSIVDMLGSAIALELLGVDTLSSGPVPMGRGFVRCAHGKMPLPAPATAYLLRGVVTVGVDRNVEMVTPTGAAIIAAFCDAFGPSPAMTLRSVGYGAGDRDDADVPNLLRVFLGEIPAARIVSPTR